MRVTDLLHFKKENFVKIMPQELSQELIDYLDSKCCIPPETFYILTELGEPLMTELDEHLITE